MNWSRLIVEPGTRVRVLGGKWQGQAGVVRQDLGVGVAAVTMDDGEERVFEYRGLRAIGWEPRPWPILLAEGGAITVFAIGVWELLWWGIGR